MGVTSSGTAQVTLPTEEQILITRTFDAPRDLVWRAYTTPELVRRWWAGRQGAMTVADIDLRVGGRWRYVMTANDGQEVAFHGEYREIVPVERLVYTEVYEMPGASDEDGAVDTVTFTEQDGRTTVAILMVLPSREVRDFVLGSGMEVGLQQAMDLLEEVAVSLR